MLPIWKAKWVAALRSGRYSQGKGALKWQSGKVCCLGVLCDLVDPKGWVPTGGGGQCFVHEACSGLPSERIGKLVDLDYSQSSKLAGLNDRGDTFEQIAAYIERHL